MRTSIVCGVKDRGEHLAISLASWLARPEVDEVLLVDWSSTVPVASDDPRVVIARVEGQPHWSASRCHNLGLLLSAGGLVLRLDADDVLHDDFFARHPFKEDEIPPFYFVNQELARDDNETHLAGVVYARRCDFLAVGGYNERIEVYGYEDTDLVLRMAARSFDCRFVDLDTLHHLPHDEGTRFVNQPAAKFEDLHRRFGDSGGWSYKLLGKGDKAIVANKMIAERAPWSTQDRKARWDVRAVGVSGGRFNRFVCEEVTT